MIVALQFYGGDAVASMALARLLADLEPRYRNDVLLALVCQPDTEDTELVRRTVLHCRRKFPTELVRSPLGAHGHPQGCTALWVGTVRHYYAQYLAGTVGEDWDYQNTLPRGDAVLTLDGNDVLPLHRGWVDLVLGLHSETLAAGKLVTGSPYFLGECPLHVNPCAVFQLEVFGKTKLATDVPEYDGTVMTNFDVYHREEMLAHARLSSVVRTDWRGCGRCVTRELLRARRREAVFLHGYKDVGMHALAREVLSEDPNTRPDVKVYDLAALRVQERLRRDFEEAQKCGL